MLVGKAWSFLPLGEVAHRYSLFSAACAALAATLVAQLAGHLCGRMLPEGSAAGHGSGPARFAPLVATGASGLGLAAAPAFWAQATVAEVYTLNALLLAAILGLLICWSDRRAPGGQIGLLALATLVLGLGLGNHVTLVFVLPLGLFYAASYGLPTVTPRRWLIVGLALAAGLSVYAYLPIRAAQGPVANWGDPSSAERLLRHVTAADYQGYLLGRPWPEVLLRVPVVARLLFEQFTWVGVVLLLVGIWAAWQRLRRESLLLLALALAHVAFALLYNAEGSQVYLLPAYLVGALFLGLGAGWAARQVALEARQFRRWAGLVLVGLLVLLTPAARAATAYGDVDISGDRQALEYAVRTLTAAQPSAVLTTARDEETFALWYAQLVLGVRPDVVVIDTRLLRHSWYRDSLERGRRGYRPG